MLSIYGKTYWDVEIQVDLSTLSAGKGKVDVPVQMAVGGFACNSARAVEGLEAKVVTVCAPADQKRLQYALPASATLCPILSDDDPALLPDISVILNPASDCRILRDPGDDDDPLWTIDSIAPEAWQSELHLLGRIPRPFAGALIEKLKAEDKRVAWCGGDALPLALEKKCDALCVNTAEALSLLGRPADSSSTEELATALAERAEVAGAMRLVTGRGAQPSVVALREGSSIRSFQSDPEPIARDAIVGFLGVGDAFAANFLVTAYLRSDGSLRESPDVEAGLAAAQDAATHFLTHPRPRGGG
jgi:sugar/nucleoside kinase (ribokinase family)